MKAMKFSSNTHNNVELLNNLRTSIRLYKLKIKYKSQIQTFNMTTFINYFFFCEMNKIMLNQISFYVSGEPTSVSQRLTD